MKYPFTLCAFADEAANDLTGQLDALVKNSIGWLELRGVDGRNVSALSAGDARAIRARLDDRGVRVWAIGSPTGKISVADDFQPHLDSFRHMVELAGLLGASHYRLFSFYVPRENGKVPSSARDAALECLSRLAEAAKGSGLVLCHENEKEIYGEKADACLDIHKSLPDIRAVFDPANFIQAGQDTLPAWEMLEPYVEYFHIKDALPDGRVVPAGHGAGQIPELLSRYGAGGGRILTIEPHLSVFSGLSELERGQKSGIDEFAYPTRLDAFDAAVAALRKII